MDGNLWTVNRVAKTFCGENEPSLKLKNSTENAVKEKITLNLDSSKAKKQLGWFAQMPISTFLCRTRRWYEMSIEGAPVDLLCKQELEYYHNLTVVQ